MIIPRWYILNEHGEPLLSNHECAAKWLADDLESGRRQVIVNMTGVGGTMVSTHFTGMDYSCRNDGAPLLWETTVRNAAFGEAEMERCTGSREQAEAMHQRVVESLRKPAAGQLAQ